MANHPLLYQINTRVWLTRLRKELGRPVTLDDVPDAELDRLARMGFDWVWLLSVWQTGPAAREVSRSNLEWRRELRDTLADLCDDDIPGSGFAVTGYSVHDGMGGNAALARLRERLSRRGLRLMLDFVPNHVGLGHPWVDDHPECFVAGTETDLTRAPRSYTRVRRARGDLILAHGRDPYLPAWPDTLQLDYSNPATQEAMISELLSVAGQCDGARCDMAMLVLPDVFERTWGRRPPLFWPTATRRVRQLVPGFLLMAEVYWDLEWELQQQGFDYAYDKRLYDRLRDRQARPVRDHLGAAVTYQQRLSRFLENHDEARAATTFPLDAHRAAAVITFLSPGMRFFHDGQLEGRKRRISPHLCRAPDEPVDPEVARFYDQLLTILRHPALRDGEWQLLGCSPAWEGNWTWDCFVVFAWQGPGGGRALVTVNYAANQSQCYVRLPFAELEGRSVQLRDLLGGDVYDRDARGIYIDAPPWGASVFSVQ